MASLPPYSTFRTDAKVSSAFNRVGHICMRNTLCVFKFTRKQEPLRKSLRKVKKSTHQIGQGEAKAGGHEWISFSPSDAPHLQRLLIMFMLFWGGDCVCSLPVCPSVNGGTDSASVQTRFFARGTTSPSDSF